MRNITVLVTGCGGMYTLSHIMSLKENGERNIRVIGTDIDPKCYSVNILDGFFEVPEFSNPQYMNIILKICEEENVDVVFPTASAELKSFAMLEEKFLEAGTRLIISNEEGLGVLLDKLKAMAYFKSHGMIDRKFMIAENKYDLCKARNYIGESYVVKSAFGSGSRGVRIVDDSIDPQEIFLSEKPGITVTSRQLDCTLQEEFPPLLVDTYIKGDEYTVELVAKNGEVVAICGRINPVINNSIAMCSKVFEHKEAFGICKAIVSDLKLNGNISADFIIENGKAELLEVNPRIGALTGIITSAGVNLPYIGVKVALGENLDGININPNQLSMKVSYYEHCFMEE